MNILLLYPEFPDTFWSFKHALPFIRKKATLPPLGLATIAAMLPQDWAVRLVDLNVRPVAQEEIEWADLVFLSAMTVQRESARQVIARCNPANTKVVAGGPLFTAEHEDFPGVDHFVLNEAEITLPLFLADLAKGKPQRVYASDEFADITTTPIPRWDLLDMKAYASMSVQWSRGCPFRCEFCDITRLFGHRPRVKTASQMIAELESLRLAGWRSKVFFVDDNLIGNKRYLKAELLPALIAWQKAQNYRVPFYTEASINLAQDSELVDMLVAAGFNMVFIGIETPEEAALVECGKTQNTGRDLVADIKTLQRAGLQVQGGFIVGFDTDDPATIFQRQIDFIRRSGVVTAMVGILNAPTGTKLWERLKAAGRLQGRSTGDNVDGQTNIIPIMDMEVLRRGYRQIMVRIYAPRQYYRRVWTFLREYRVPKAHQPVDLQYCLALFRAAWHLGLARRQGRFWFWLLMARTFFRRIRLLPLAVALAINGYHFRRITEQHIQ